MPAPTAFRTTQKATIATGVYVKHPEVMSDLQGASAYAKRIGGEPGTTTDTAEDDWSGDSPTLASNTTLDQMPANWPMPAVGR